MGDKSSARETMKACGVPTVPGSDGCIDTVEEALEIAKQYVGDTPSIILMPEGSLTVPRVE